MLQTKLFESNSKDVTTKTTVTIVINKKTSISYKKSDVYIGRPSKFGNPFSVKEYGREGCIKRFEIYFTDKISWNSNFAKEIKKLQGKRLVCYCKPLACHGDIIAKYLNNL